MRSSYPPLGCAPRSRRCSHPMPNASMGREGGNGTETGRDADWRAQLQFTDVDGHEKTRFLTYEPRRSKKSC